MSDREQYKIMIENDVDFVIGKIIEKNNELTSQGVKIKELENINEKLSLALESAENKLQQKDNIIKEVREKIESVQILGLRSGKTLIATLLNDILEILDKENK